MAKKTTIGGLEPKAKRNPVWTRDELVLALDLYLKHGGSQPSQSSGDVDQLSRFLGLMAGVRGISDRTTFRNANGVIMKMMNFRRLDPKYMAGGKVGLARGSKLEEVVWNEFSANPAALAAVVTAIHAGVENTANEAPYWVFVCNPKRWAIDRFLDGNFEHDTWGVRQTDADRFAPGQLGIVRVGVDRRTVTERGDNPPLDAGIYALCEVESAVFAGTGASDKFWAEGEARDPGWPTVRIRYLRTYRNRPLTIERLRAERPGVSHLLLDGFQASSFPISASDFREVMNLLHEDVEDLVVVTPDDGVMNAETLAALQNKYTNASPEVKERVSRYIERGSVGSEVKRALGFKCQICEALGRNPLGFRKKSGDPYAEAHHVTPVSGGEVGSLAASNIMIVCANHHRQMHYGEVNVAITAASFDFSIEGRTISIPRFISPD
jgi:predicted HNH restriction endonuclease